jgi:HK97 family phage major capsid protein
MDLALLAEKIGAHATETKIAFAGAKDTMTGIDNRISAIEQQMARRGSGSDFSGVSEYKSVGQTVAEHDAVEVLRKNGGRGSARVTFETKALSSASNSAGVLVAPDRQSEIITLPRRTPRIRDLLAVGTTISNTIHYNREKTVTNNAAMAAEGTVKGQSDIVYEAQLSAVRTLAHYIIVSRQIMDDFEQLKSMINSALLYMLNSTEDTQLLLGAGTGEDLLGLIPASTPYAAPWTSTGDTRMDVVLKAIAQCEIGSQLPCTGIILNSLDWAAMTGIKNADGNYLSNGPFSANPPTLWGRPVVATTVCPANKFVVLNGTEAAMIFDRMEAEILISSEHSDLFVRNQLAIRCEKRLAFVIKRSAAIVSGTFPA